MILKFFHVLVAVVWVGGAILLQVFAEFAVRSNDSARAAEFSRQAELIGNRLFAPSTLLMLGLGIWLVIVGHWGFGHFWIIYSLVALGVSMAVGAGFLGPQAGKLATMIQAEGLSAPTTQARIRTVRAVGRTDAVLLVSIIFMMVTKLGQ
jgi:uncharacterized membrane protein